MTLADSAIYSISPFISATVVSFAVSISGADPRRQCKRRRLAKTRKSGFDVGNITLGRFKIVFKEN